VSGLISLEEEDMTRFLLIRHGQTEWNRVERFRGRADIGLNETGIEQAHKLARRLAEEPISALYSSPLRRALQTAQPIARALGLSVQPLEGLLDIDYGAWQGLTPQEAAQRFPALYRLWLEEPHRVRFPQGESLSQVRRRCLAAVEELALKHQGQTVALVSHKIVNKVLLCAILGLGEAHIWRIEQDNGCINSFEKGESGFRILFLNDTSHLR